MTRETIAGRYRIERPLAEGGMAQVWLARQTSDVGFEKLVVLKTVLPQLMRTERFDTMFRDEARIAADLRHPNVVQLLDAGSDTHHMFLALELLEGVDAARLVRMYRRAQEQMPLDVALPVLIDAAHGLAYVHEKRDLAGRPLAIVHRDISPSNLFVTLAGVTKVLDFGVAHARNQLTVTEAGVLKGKAPYMSPEQILGDPIDHRSDQFALAIVGAELLTGRRIFQRARDLDTLNAILDGDPTIPATLAEMAPAAIVDVLVRALSFDRERRYPTSLAFAEALEGAARAVGLRIGRGALRAAVARALELDEPEVATTTPGRARRPALKDVAVAVEDRPTAIVPTPPPVADASWSRQRAAELAPALRDVVLRGVGPRSGLSDSDRALCREASRVARQLVRLREQPDRALLLAIAAEIADENDDPQLIDDALLLAPQAEPALLMRALELSGDRKKAAGEAAAARERYLSARVLAGGDPAFASLVERNLADLALDDGDLSLAEEHARRACALARMVASRFALARAVFALARIVLRRGHLDPAELLLDQAARTLEEQGDERFLARVTFERALVCEARGDAELAAQLMRAALPIHERTHDVVFAARAKENLALLDAARQAPEAV